VFTRRLHIVSSALLFASSDAGDLSSITWQKQGTFYMAASTNTFRATSDDNTQSNYAYSEYSNVVSFTVKPNFASASPKKTEVGFVCGDSHTDSIPGTGSWGFGTGIATAGNMRTMFYNNGSADGIDAVSLTATTEIRFKIEDSEVEVSVCTDDTPSSCTENRSYPMGNLAQPSCMAKIAMGTDGAGFEVKAAVTIPTTTTTVTQTNTTTVAPATTVAATTTGTNTTTVAAATSNSGAVASDAIYASISWMGVFPMAMSIAAAAHIV